MDTFFQKLRDIQKKERTAGTLSEIDDSFYTDASNYLQELLKRVNNNPLSLEAYQLRDAQRITTEICERREFKIVSTAATNVQKDHDVFKGHKTDSELYDVIPYNVTPEEEEFYRKIVDMMVSHREQLMEKIIINKQAGPKVGFKSSHKKEERKKEQTDDAQLQSNAPSQKPHNTEKSRPKTPVLDEDQIAMMFGKAPDDVLLDENNNPVKQVKRDIKTPFKPPEPPREDTVTLQNTEEKKSEAVPEDEFEAQQKKAESHKTKTESKADKKAGLNDLELVEFKQEITTDILDENEKTYGPFSVDDIVLLPKSIVEILESNNMINVV
ncbi:MAG: hypothetical protein BZ135_05315 [Methanosphaera sp. rholeuAM6]|nr:MAG: hypothetical protein BZ135_05315 [Methanosphaera sp. rholeuAM6]